MPRILASKRLERIDYIFRDVINPSQDDSDASTQKMTVNQSKDNDKQELINVKYNADKKENYYEIDDHNQVV